MQWKISPSFPSYEVSEFGEVRRVAPGIGGRAIIGKIMKPYVREDGYRMYILRKDNKSFHRKAHQMVIEAFIMVRPTLANEVRHLDGARHNDHYSNLAWGTSAENKADMVSHGTRLRGGSHPFSKLTDANAKRLKELWLTGEYRQRELGDMFGIKQGTVSRIISGKRWGHL